MTIPVASPISLSISATPGALVAFLFVTPDSGIPCPCSPGAVPLAPSSCVGTQSIDLPVFASFCPLSILVGVTDAAGFFTVSSPTCPPGTMFATQAVVVDPSCTPTRVWTQAYDVACL